MSDCRRVYCVIMRGGTSKGVFFHENDLPSDPAERDAVILKAFGSPDVRQINGLGGANSSTSKVAIISASSRSDADVDYTFGQVSLDQPYIGKRMNCGNISAAVGPFAVDEGLIKAVEPTTVVRIFNTNTKKRIISYVPARDGKAVYNGDFEIHGVPGTGSRIDLEFEEPGGALTGKTLPTGVPRQVIEVDGKEYTASIVDAANPVVFVRAEELGFTGTELPWEFERRPDSKNLSAVVERIRGIAAQMIGLVDDPARAALESPELPKIGLVRGATEYVDAVGRRIAPEQIDLVGRLFSMGKMIHAYMGTGAICTMVAANISGTVVNEVVGPRLEGRVTELRIGHPFGVMTVAAGLDESGIKSCTIARTARRIMEGWVYV